MDIKQLFTGVGIVIDNEVFNKTSSDRILTIVKYLEEDCNIPLVKYDELPNYEVLYHCNSINFILLDWSLINLPIGIQGDAVKESHNEIIEFLKKAQDICFAPIFLFSNENIDDIKQEVRRNGINKLPILFESKSTICDEDGTCRLWEILTNWIDRTSGIYVLKEWNRSFDKARMEFLVSLNKKNAHWPKSICKASEEDTVNVSEELSNLISNNLLARMQPVKFEEEQIFKDEKTVQQDDVLSIIEMQRFTSLIDFESYITTGDFFEKDGHFYINIRPACDCVPRENHDQQIYLLECDSHGKKVDFDKDYGNYRERENEAIIGPIYGNRFFSVKFKKFSIQNTGDFISYRKGRIIHPFITRIIQKYGLYIQRQALPRMPYHAVYTPEEIKQLESERECEEG